MKHEHTKRIVVSSLETEAGGLQANLRIAIGTKVVRTKILMYQMTL